ncbi:MAG: M56 family metallopeptidase [Limisphaerales bacterium]
MNSAELFDATFKLFRSLAVEATIVIAFAAALHGVTTSAYWRRTIWQVATLGLAALVVFETTGVARGLVAWAGTTFQTRRADPADEPAGRAAASGRAEPQRSPGAGAPGMARPYQRFTVPMHAKSRQSHLDNPTLTRPPATLSHPMGEGRGEGASRFTPPIQLKKAAPLTVPSAPPLLWWLGPVWILGMVAVLARVALGRCLLCLFCRRRRGHADSALVARVEALARRMGIRRRVRVIASAGLSGPIAFGSFRPTIGLPANCSFNPAQQEAMLAHELAHLAAHDPFWLLLADTVSATLWWHPLVWWTRHQLHSASESAADEASLLLNDGPSVLAECLVELGGRLPQRAPLAWMRIEGNGFRSGLGRRVERLLKLDGHAWQPRARMKSWLAKTVGPALLVVVAVVATAWTQPGDFGQENSIRSAVKNSWRSSLVSSALFALIGPQDTTSALPVNRARADAVAQPKTAEPAVPIGAQLEATNSPELTNRIVASTLMTDGIVLFQSGKFDEAEAKLGQAAEQDTNNATASYYLALIKEARHRENERKLLDRIVLRETPMFVAAPLSNILKFLVVETSQLDPERKAVEFGAPTNVLEMPISLPAMKKVTLRNFLDVLTTVSTASKTPLAYAVEERGIVFSQRPSEPVKFFTRTYKVDPNTFVRGLESLNRLLGGVGPTTTSGSGIGVTPTNSTNNVNMMVGRWLAALGLEFPANEFGSGSLFGHGLPPAPRKASFFNERTGVLFVRATLHDLDVIDRAMQALNSGSNWSPVEVAQSWNPPTNPSARTNVVSTGPGHNRIYSKLDEINIRETPSFDGVPLSQIVKWLHEESRKLDSDKQGINFMIANRPDDADPSAGVPKIDPRTGLPILLPPKASAVDLKDVKIQLPPLDHLRLADVLEAVCKAADQPIKYSVEEYAVVFSYRTPEPVKWYTRTYKVDPNTFVQALQKFQAQNSGGGQTGQTNNPPLREFFSAFGADFRTNAVDFKAVGQQRAVFFNDGTGVLFVRATQPDLDTIDQALQVLNLAPPQIMIEVRLAEITESDSKALGFDWFLGNTVDRTGRNVTGGVRGQQTNNGAATGTITGILTDPQFASVLKTLERRSGVDILSAPRVTTLSGREAEVGILETRTVVTGVEIEKSKKDHDTASNESPRIRYKTSPMGFGPTITIRPSVRPDGYTIQMEVKGTVKDFLGYDDPREVKVRELSTHYQEPLPRYRTREITGNALVWDGQTVVLGGLTYEDVLKLKDQVPVLGDIPLMGRLFRHESTSTVKKRLIIFLTPTIVDPAGNRVHADANLPYDPNTVSPQPTR